ncbi:MAG TPA: hypothetical protein VGY98_02035, partial [Verrucomicrobiae bacterium]|nr:hypothetical protein [Verrucomicrobiae bacterium]
HRPARKKFLQRAWKSVRKGTNVKEALPLPEKNGVRTEKRTGNGLANLWSRKKITKKAHAGHGQETNGKSRSKTMNETLLSRIGKLFFPRLAPDQRHHRMIIVLLVTLTCLFSAGILIEWMMSTRGIHIAVGHSFPFPRK